jgi:class 3 adenylate cyclase
MSDIDEALRWVDDMFAKQHLPIPGKPKGKDPQFELPDDPDALKSPRLGDLMMRMSAWLSRSQYLYGLADSELVIVDKEFARELAERGPDIRERIGRVAADVVEATMMNENEDEELEELYKRRVKLLSVTKRLESMIKIYERGYQALSRELSRRELEARRG